MFAKPMTKDQRVRRAALLCCHLTRNHARDPVAAWSVASAPTAVEGAPAAGAFLAEVDVFLSGGDIGVGVERHGAFGEKVSIPRRRATGQRHGEKEQSKRPSVDAKCVSSITTVH